MNLQQLQQTKEATEVIAKAGEIINAIDKRNGKVDRVTIERAEAVKAPLLKIALSMNIYAVSARHTVDAINNAIAFAEGDETAKQRYLDACQRANELNRQLNKDLGES